MYSTYNCIALGLLSTVAALPAFGKNRLMFYREAASGLNRCEPSSQNWHELTGMHHRILF